MRYWLLLTALLIAPLAPAAEFAVVVASNSAVGMLDRSRLRTIFLRQSNFESGQKLVPVNLLGDDRVRRRFESEILQMPREELNRFWINSHFQGIKPPATQASLQSMKLFIERVEGAIGYLPLDMVDDSLKVVHEF